MFRDIFLKSFPFQIRLLRADAATSFQLSLKRHARWEVHNFSVAAVECFLRRSKLNGRQSGKPSHAFFENPVVPVNSQRFLYSGHMPQNTTVAIETALMAEMYGVKENGVTSRVAVQPEPAKFTTSSVVI